MPNKHVHSMDNTNECINLQKIDGVFEFWSRSYGMSLQPIFLIFLGQVLFFEIYPDMLFFFPKLFVDLEI